MDWEMTFLDELQKMKKEMDRMWENLCQEDFGVEQTRNKLSRTGSEKKERAQRAHKCQSAHLVPRRLVGC